MLADKPPTNLNGLEPVSEPRQKYLIHQRCRQGAHVAVVGVEILVRRTKVTANATL